MAESKSNCQKIHVKCLCCDILQTPKKYEMVWVQGTVRQVLDQDHIEVQDHADSSAISVEAVTKNDCIKFKKGDYCQVIGQVVLQPNRKPQIRADKVVTIEDPVLQEAWPLEVEEAKEVLAV